MTIGLSVATLLTGLLPAAVAWVGKIIIDEVVRAMDAPMIDPTQAIAWVGVEAILVAVLLGAQRTSTALRTMLGMKLGDKVSISILEKASTLSLAHFEDPETHDHIARTRREASTRPLDMLVQHFTLVRDTVALCSYGAILIGLSPYAVLLVVGAGVPGFLAELHFARASYALARRRAETHRERTYLENLVARGDFAKEVQAFGLGAELLNRFRDLTRQIYEGEKKIIRVRESVGFALGLLGLVALYGAYAWVALETAYQTLTIGAMAMYLVVFRQSQSSVTSLLTVLGGMYENHLFLTDLRALLALPARTGLTGTPTEGSKEEPQSSLPSRETRRGLKLEAVSFSYAGEGKPALSEVSLDVKAGQTWAVVGDNGSGKSTLLKILTGLYPPSQGQISLDGTPYKRWAADQLRARISPVFQDFNRFKLSAGENIGFGDVENLWSEDRWASAADRALAGGVVSGLEDGFRTRLGRWFRGGHELSAGQWQRLALARGLMKSVAPNQTEPQLLVMDEPTSALDPEAEDRLIESVREIAPDAMLVIVTHRLSTARKADKIIRLQQGQIAEQGTHAELVQADGTYAALFRTQASGYSAE